MVTILGRDYGGGLFWLSGSEVIGKEEVKELRVLGVRWVFR